MMDNFIYSAIGQSKSLDALFRLYKSGRIPHALIFKGSAGVGKHLAAINFLKLINQGFISDSKIQKIEKLEEPFVKYIFPLPRGKNETSGDLPLAKLSKSELESVTSEINQKIENPYHKILIEKANNIKISSIRDIKKFTSLNYDEIKNRAILINEADRMNEESQNALLKTLEEPPDGIIFILLSHNPQKLLTTITSRCWEIDFSPLSNSDLADVLLKYFKIDFDESKGVIPFSNGSAVKAIELLNMDFEKMLESVIQILRFSIVKRFNSAYKNLEEFNKNYSSKAFLEVLKMILYWMMDAQKSRVNTPLDYFKDSEDIFKKYNEKYSSSDLFSVYSKIDSLIGLVDKNISLNIISMNAIFELSSLSKR